MLTSAKKSTEQVELQKTAPKGPQLQQTWEKLVTDTRFQFLRFVCGKTNDRSVLDRALGLKSRKIRGWASKEMDKLSRH